MTEHFEYTTITVKIKGASSGVFSSYQRKGVDDESFAQLERMGRDGWDLIAVIPVSHGALGAQATDAAICFLKRIKMRGSQPRRDTDLSTAPDAPTTSNNAITGQEFDVLVARDRMKKECGSNNYWLTTDDWNFITANRAPEALPAIEGLIARLTPEQDSDGLRTQLLTFYSLLRLEEATESLYKLAGQPKCFDKVHRIINSLGLFSVSKIMEMLESPDRETRLNALRLVWTQKAQYTSEDAREYQELADAVVKAFPLADAFEKKRLLGKVKRVWKCVSCKAEIEEGVDVCQCGGDRYGVTSEHRGLRVVLERLERRQSILQSGQFDS